MTGDLPNETGDCYHCGDSGQVLYREIPDWLHSAEGEWDFMKCPNCGVIWLGAASDDHSMPDPYEEYYTHDVARPGRVRVLSSLRENVTSSILTQVFAYDSLAKDHGDGGLGAALGSIPALRDLVGARVMFLNFGSGKRLLDVGCGDGSFLQFMKRLGWEVAGVDSDPAAVRLAQSQNLRVVRGTLEETPFPGESFDAITLSHLIEHVDDPRSLLAECRRLLKKDGVLVILTPNTESFGHKFFGDKWRGLEPPRHLILFNERTLVESLERENLLVLNARTISRLAVTFWTHRRPRTSEGSLYGRRPSLGKSLTGIAFFLLEELGKMIDRRAGEEILAIARK